MARSRKDLLLDILREARNVQEFVAGCDMARFATEKMRLGAVRDSLGIIGEATSRLDDDTKQALAAAGIPVRGIVAMRNIIVHEYWRSNVAALWQASTEHMAPLIAAVGTLLPVRIEPASDHPA